MKTRVVNDRLISAITSFSLVLISLLTVPLALPSAHAQETRYFRIVGPGATAITGVTADGYVTWTNELTNVTCTVQMAQTLSGESNWVDYVQVPVSNQVVMCRIFDLNAPVGMVLIPAGSFTMGDTFGDSMFGEVPLHTVYVSQLYMDQYQVTQTLWDTIKTWAATNGYGFDRAGSSKAANHPVQTINWYDTIKWCNARSQKEGLTPCYYTDTEMTVIYKTGRVAPFVKWDANGYRLPTEAEWEKSARGGVSGHRFPWSDTDTVQHGRANYYSRGSRAYDTSPTRGYHPTFNDGVSPYTSPVGYFAANGYGLYDMTGNVWEWCWDRSSSSYYSVSPGTDPRGPSSGDNRVLRGGVWEIVGDAARCAYRYSFIPDEARNTIGFRCVRGL